MQTDVEPCGKITGIVVGVTSDRPELHAFGSALHPDTPLVMQKREWEALLKGMRPTEVLDWRCGDHGSEIESDLVVSATKGVNSRRAPRVHLHRRRQTWPIAAEESSLMPATT